MTIDHFTKCLSDFFTTLADLVSKTQLTQRLKAIREALGNITQQELADLIGVGKSTVSYIENGRSKPTYDQLQSLLHNCNVNPGYLIDGIGPMFVGNYLSPEAEDSKIEYTLNDPPATYTAGQGIVLVPINAQSAYMNHPEHQLPRVSIPGVQDPDSKVFEVTGDYMYPVICSEDFVVCSRIDVDRLRDGDLCVVISQSSGILISYVRTLAAGLRCYPANREGFEPVTISYDDLYELWVVKMRITHHVAGNHLPLDWPRK